MDNVKKVLLSAFQCDRDGVSEAFVGFNWVKQVARFNDVYLISPSKPLEIPENVRIFSSGKKWHFTNQALESMNRAVKLDYFFYDLYSFFRFRKLLRQTHIFHHITPIAPRYPSSLGSIAQRFVFGPIGGGLRVPNAFKKVVEKSEPTYFKLRNIDMFRLRFDPFLRKTYSNASIILIAGSYMYDIIPEEYHYKLRVLLETGINPEEYQVSTMRITNDTLNILYVGRIVPYKGLEFLLRALGKLPRKILNNIRLHVLGEGGSYADKCKRISNEVGIGREVKFYGFVSKEEVLKWYKTVDLVCLPTLAETSGNVILEAMATGVPVMAINFGGPSEILNDKTGFLVDPVSPEYIEESMAMCLKQLVGNSERLRQMGLAARERVFTEFSWTSKGNRIEDIYDEVMAN